MKKQTAVEWFFSELKRMQYFIGNDMLESLKQAKEMEKQQIEDAYEEGCFDNILDESTDNIRAKEYYNETYGK